MPSPVPLPHPRKLHANLCACPSAAARAQAVLVSMCGATGARGGVLLLLHGDALTVAASLPAGEVSTDLLEAAQRAWHAQPVEAPPDSATLDLRSLRKPEPAADEAEVPTFRRADGALFMPRALTVHRDARWTPVGLAMLETDGARQLAPLRRAHVDALCNALIDSGDVASSGLSIPVPV